MNGYWGTYPSGGQWRWRLVSGNGKTIATAGESYHNYDDCVRSIEIAKQAGRENWPIYDQPQGPYFNSFYCFVDVAHEYRWRLYGGNQYSVAASSEGYAAKSGAHASIALVKSAHGWPVMRLAA